MLSIQILKFVAKLSLLEHGLVVAADAVDTMDIRAAPKAPKGTAGKSKDATLSDQEEGESTEEPGETIKEFKKRLERWVKGSKERARNQDRDEYKKSGNVYDKRKKTIAAFLKSLTKKKCDKCGA